MLRVLGILFLLVSASTSATAQYDPKGIELMVKACGFSLTSTNEAPNPIPVGDGRFYYLSDSDLAAMMEDRFDFDSCDWEKVTQEAYAYAPQAVASVTPEPAQTRVPSAAPAASPEYSDAHKSRIATHHNIIRTCGFISVPTDERDIEVNVGDGSSYYVSYQEYKGITNPKSGFRPCAGMPRDPAVFASMDRASKNAGMTESKNVQQELGVYRGVDSQTSPSQPQAPAVADTSTRSDIDQKLDEVISIDSRSWVLNRYTSGSARNGRIINQDLASGRFIVYGEYTYNSSSMGWIKVVFDGDRVNCVEYHDFRGTCRSLGNNPAAYVALGAVAMAASGASSSGYSSNNASENVRFCPDDAISCNSGYGQ